MTAQDALRDYFHAKMGEAVTAACEAGGHYVCQERAKWALDNVPAMADLARKAAIGEAVLAHCDGIEWSIYINGGAGSDLIAVSQSTLTDAVDGHRAPDIEAAIAAALEQGE